MYMTSHCCSHRHRPESSRRVLYVGNDLALLDYLNGALKDCDVSRAPAAMIARWFIEGQSNYSLLLFDAELPDSTGLALVGFARSVERRGRTPVIILSEEEEGSAGPGVYYETPNHFGRLAEAIERLLATSNGGVRAAR